MCGSICLQKAFVLLLLLTTVWTEVVVRIHNLHVKPSACNLVHLVHVGTPWYTWNTLVHPGTPGTPWYTGYTWVQPGTPGTLSACIQPGTPGKPSAWTLGYPPALSKTILSE